MAGCFAPQEDRTRQINVDGITPCNSEAFEARRFSASAAALGVCSAFSAAWTNASSGSATIARYATVSLPYYEAVRRDDRKAPFYWPALVGLQHDTRACDIHQFPVYRPRNGLKRPVPIHQRALHAVFGRDVKPLDHFWPRFLKSLEARKWYRTAQIAAQRFRLPRRDESPNSPQISVRGVRL